MNTTSSPVSLFLRRAVAAMAIAGCATAFADTPKLADVVGQGSGPHADPLASVDLHRAEIVGRIVGRWQGGHAARLGEGVKAKLAGLRADRLLAASVAESFEAVLEILAAQDRVAAAPGRAGASPAGTGKTLGEATRDLVYTPLTPCRLFDTRAGQSSALGQLGGAFSPTTSRNIVPAGACGIPASDVNSLLVAFTTLNNTPTSGGFITLLETGAAITTSTDIFNLGSSWSASNTVVRTGTAGQFTVFVSTADAHVVVDVLGYFSRPQATALECTTVTGTPTSVAAGQYASLPTLFCPAAHTPISLSISAAENVLVADSYTAGNAGQVFVRSLSINAQNVTGKLTCCRVPGR